MRRWAAGAAVPLLAVAVFAVYATYALSRQATYLTSGYDLGIFDQAVRQYAHFHAPVAVIKGPGYNLFADHFHPIIAALAPLYWIWDSPAVLLVAQAALIAASVPVVHDFARRRTGAAAAFAVAAAYAAGWAVQGMVNFDFHEIAFAVPLLAGAINGLDKRDDRMLLICAGLLLLCREDMGAVVVVLGLLRAWRAPRRVGWIMVAVGAAAFVVTTEVIIPAVAPSGTFSYWTFDGLGRDLPDALHTLLTRPWHVLWLFVDPAAKFKTLAYLLVPLALLSLRSRYAWIALPLIAERFLNSRANLWTTEFHYNVLPWLVFVLAMVDGAARLGVWRHVVPRRALVTWLLLVPVVVTIWPGPLPRPLHRLATGAAFRMDDNQRARRAVVKVIPRDVCVWVDDRIAPQLTNRDRVTLAGLGGPGPDFAILDLSQTTVAFQLGNPAVIAGQLQSRGYHEVFRARQIVVLQSPDYRGPSHRCRPTAP